MNASIKTLALVLVFIWSPQLLAKHWPAWISQHPADVRDARIRQLQAVVPPFPVSNIGHTAYAVWKLQSSSPPLAWGNYRKWSNAASY